MRVTPAELVLDALRQGGRVIVSTYNEPLITSEWAMAVFKEARAAGLVTGFVSNGNGTPQVLENPWCQRATSTLSGPTRTDSKERIT
jgi:pyruvate formate lyase activating enzyme